MMRVFLGLLISCLLFTHVWAEEKITRYNVIIDVQQDADFIIREEIDVISEGRQIRRGIFRDLPRFKIDEDAKIPYQYKILNVTRNGQREPFVTGSVNLFHEKTMETQNKFVLAIQSTICRADSIIISSHMKSKMKCVTLMILMKSIGTQLVPIGIFRLTAPKLSFDSLIRSPLWSLIVIQGFMAQTSPLVKCHEMR